MLPDDGILLNLYKFYLLHLIDVNNGTIEDNLINNGLSLAVGFKNGILCFLMMAYFYRNMSEIRL